MGNHYQFYFAIIRNKKPVGLGPAGFNLCKPV